MKLIRKMKHYSTKIFSYVALLSMVANILAPFTAVFPSNVYAEDIGAPVEASVNTEEKERSAEGQESAVSEDKEEITEETSTDTGEPKDNQEGDILEDGVMDYRPIAEIEVDEAVEVNEISSIITNSLPIEITETKDEVKEEVEKEYEILNEDEQVEDTKDSDWDVKDDTAETIEKVKIGVKYVFPLDEKVTLTFTRLPKDDEFRSHLKIERVKVEDLDLPGDFVTDAEYAFDITTDMENGDFEFDLTLPKPEGLDVEVSYIEKSIDEAKEELKDEDIKKVDEDKVEQDEKEDKVKVKDLDHLTLFIPTGGAVLSVSGSVNGVTQVTVGPNDVIKADITVQRSGDWGENNWESTSWRINEGSWNCADTTNHTIGSGTNTESFNITAPSTVGTYSISFRAHRDGSCGDAGVSNTFTLTNGIIVQSAASANVCNNEEDSYSLNSSGGIWTSVSGGSNINGLNTNEVKWGNSTGYGQSGLRFDSVGTQTFNENTKFLLGALTHKNWPINNAANRATLQIKLSFSKPAIPDKTFSYNFDIEETTNTPPCAYGGNCNDKITFPTSYGSEVITINDIQYTLVIDGFVNSYSCGAIGSVLNFFITEEQKDNSAYLVGHLSSVLVEKPEIRLTKKTNGQDISAAPGENLYIGDSVEWQYVVQNSGNVTLTNISLTDSDLGSITCPFTELVKGNSMTCTATGTVTEGQYENTATVKGTTPSNTQVSASDTSWYYGISKKGHLIVQKTTIPSGDQTEFTTYLKDSAGSQIGTGIITDSLDKDYEIDAGTYSVDEGDINGWAQTSNTCNNVTVAAGGTTYCTITNTKYGSLTIVKNANPHSSQSFGFTTSGLGLSSFTLSDDGIAGSSNSKIFNNLLPGTYSVSEGDVAGWDKTNAVCTSSIPGTSQIPSNLNLSSGETIVCTFTNTKLGSISGHKFVDASGVLEESNTDTAPVEGWEIWIDFDGDGIKEDGETRITGEDGSYEFNNLLPRTYVVKETMKDGWVVLVGESIEVNLTAGEKRLGVDFINTRKTGTLIVKKVVDNSDKLGTKIASDFTFKVGDSAPVSFEPTADGLIGQNTLTVNAGTYTVTEPAIAGYNTKYDNCENIEVKNGETETCTITNTHTVPMCAEEENIGADEVASVKTGTLYSGAPITDPIRVNPERALGAVDGKFYSLGKGGEIVVNFFHYIKNVPGNDLAIHEITWNRPPADIEEKAKVYVKNDETGWIYLGEASSNVDGITNFDFDNTAEKPLWINAVKLVESSEGQLGYDDGFDLDGIIASSRVCEEPLPPLVIKAQKIVCDNEADLPDYGAGGPNMTATTAQDWVDSHESCRFEEGWNFQWGDDKDNNPSDTHIGPADGWTTFGPTNTEGFTSVEIPYNDFKNTSHIKVREELKENYIPFTYVTSGNNNSNKVSAEIYCDIDVLNYDNDDRITNPQPDKEYYCVAWNVRKDSDVTVCKLDEEENGLPGWTLTLIQGDLLETVEVKTKGPDSAVYSSSDLAKGDYALIARGTYTYRGNTGLLVDPAFSQRLASDGLMGPYFPWISSLQMEHPGALGIKIDNVAVNWSDYLSADHRYALGFTGHKGPFNFNFWDNVYGDNKGSMFVDIYKGYVGVTGEDGCYTFKDILFGDYKIGEIMKDGWRNVSGLGEVTIDDFIGNFNVVNELDVYDIGGHKWSDLNRDGNEDATEPRLSGWTIFIDANKNGTLDEGEISQVTTDPDGQYLFKGLVAGEAYTVCEELTEDWVQTYPINDNNNCHVVSLDADSLNNNFGNIQKGKITVTKFNDKNGNGEFDEGENVLSGWEINLSQNPTKTTDDNGHVLFNQLVPGNYDLSETMQDGWDQTNIYCEDSGEGVKITKDGEAYGHHGNCEGWNGCKDASTCALWACEVNGYSSLVSYGEARPCTQFNNCHLFNYRGSVQMNWGKWCEVMGVTDIVCSNSLDSDEGDYYIGYVSGNNITVDPGQNKNCYIGNIENSKLYISETNDSWPNNLGIGDEFTYTIKVIAKEGPVNNALLTNLPPKGFEPQGGTFKAVSDLRGDLDTSGVTYASPGKWDLGNLKEDEIVTISYKAKVLSEVTAGIYPDLSFANGKGMGGKDLPALSEASGFAVNDGIVDGNFVGTQVRIALDTGLETEVKVKEEEKGDVLGASTELPATGARTFWVTLVLVLVSVGGALLLIGGLGTMKKDKKQNKKVKTAKKVLTGLLFAGIFTLTGSKSYAAVTNVRLSQPKSPSNSDFSLVFVAMDTEDRDMTAKCYYKFEGGAYSQFGPEIAIASGESGDSRTCAVGEAVLDEEGNYTFKVEVTPDGDLTKVSNEVVVDYDGKGPDRPKYIEKKKINSCVNKITLKTADDGETTVVKIYADDDREIDIDDSHKIETETLGPDKKFDFEHTVSGDDCKKTWYYAVVAFDDAGNASKPRSETITTTTTTTEESEEEVTGAIPVEGGTGLAGGEGEVAGVAGEEAGTEGEEIKIGGEGEEGSVLGETTEEKTEGKVLFKSPWFWVVAVGLGIIIISAIKGSKKKD